jgi:hypothetical protein
MRMMDDAADVLSRSTTYWLLRIGSVAGIWERSSRRWATSCTP